MSSQKSEISSINIYDESSMENETVVNSRYTQKLILNRFHGYWFVQTFANNRNLFFKNNLLIVSVF